MNPPPYPRIVLKKGKERSLQNFHPWLFSGAVAKQDSTLSEGCVAEVFTHDNRYAATVHFHHGSIVARVLSFRQREIDASFFEERFCAALACRERLGLTRHSEAPAYRLVNGEGDGLPGLVIDIYHHTAVVQAHTAGMHLSLPLVLRALLTLESIGMKSVYNKSGATLKIPGIETANGYLHGGREAGIIVENGLRFRVDWEAGQKTGFYLDQRDNRKLLLRYAAGRKVLNAFAYSGGFSLYALQAGASVDSVDSASRSRAWTEENVSLNISNPDHRFHETDVFGFLKSAGRSFNLIVLDPPAFAKRLSAVDQAVTGYRNLNYEALKKITESGILFTFSCSQVIDTVLFQRTVFQAAVMARRNVRILHRLSQAPDHPVSLFHPEGAYLKGLVLYVE